MLYFRPFPHLLFLLLIFILEGCCGNNDLEIAPALKTAWLPYQPQQKTIFIGEKGDTISFLTDVHTYYQQNTDPACGPYRVQTEEVTFTTPTDPDFKLVISLSHQIILNLKSFRITPNMSNLEAKFNTVSELYISHDWRDTYTKETIINGRNFAQVLHVFGVNTPGPLSFSDILYARDKGLIGFKILAGGWYFPL